MADFHKVASTSEILQGEVKSFVVENQVVAVCNLNGNFYAFKDECSHEQFPLSDGDLEGENIMCMYHGAEFDVKTGEAVCLPAVEPIEVYEVKVDGDDIYVSLGD